jgi:hypothetical protein
LVMVFYCHSVVQQIAGRTGRSSRQRISYPQASVLAGETHYALEPPTSHGPTDYQAIFFVRILTE